MYKTLSPQYLGISGRQSELIELAMTYDFAGLDLDIDDMLKRTENHGLESARRFLDAANLKMGSFDAPLDLGGEESKFRVSLVTFKKAVEIAAAVGCQRCTTQVAPGSDDHPYHENFELYRKRLGEVAEFLAEHEMRLGLELQALPSKREGSGFPFVHEAEAMVALVKAVGSPQVGLAFDSWDWWLGGGDLETLKQLSGQQIVVARLADAPSDVEAGQLSEDQRVLPGEGGALEVAPYVASLSAMGFDGPLSLCPAPSQFLGMTRDSIVQKAQRTFEQLWIDAGFVKPPQEEEPAEEEAATVDN